MKVNFELAKMLKEAGYDIPSAGIYHNSGSYHEGSSRDYNTDVLLNDVYTSAPELHEVTDWLRTKGLHVCVEPVGSDTVWTFFIYELHKGFVTRKRFNDYNRNEFHTHDSALTAAITHSLKLLKEKV